MKKLISWNVNGIRAVAKKGFTEWVLSEFPDVLCLQETKAEESQVPDDVRNIMPYTSYWESGEKKGYSGVATFVRDPSVKVISRSIASHKEFDSEGRILVTDHGDFTLCNIYFPSGQSGDGRVSFKLAFYDACLEYFESLRKQGRELIICGDYNTAHNEIDIARPKENENVSGFLRIERDWMDKIESIGYCDTFRCLNPAKADSYTWWSYRTAARSRNIGWRLDYFYVTKNLLKRVRRAEILSGVTGSDHCPVLMEID